MAQCLASLAVASAMFAVGPAHALGREVTFEEILAQHQHQITWVATCGSWQADGHRGGYRVTHASLYAQSFLYVQWMEADAQGRNTARFTLSVPELNNDHADISLEKLRCEATKTGVIVRAEADFGQESKHGAIEIVLSQSPGQYRFRRLPPP